MSRERDQLVQNIERMAESQPARAQDLIREALNSAHTYIDFEKLAERISSGEDFTSSEGLSSLINVDKLVADFKTDKVSQNLRDRL